MPDLLCRLCQSLPPQEAATGTPETPWRCRGMPPSVKKASDGFFNEQPESLKNAAVFASAAEPVHSGTHECSGPKGN
jgi:hypothetical protein